MSYRAYAAGGAAAAGYLLGRRRGRRASNHPIEDVIRENYVYLNDDSRQGTEAREKLTDVVDWMQFNAGLTASEIQGVFSDALQRPVSFIEFNEVMGEIGDGLLLTRRDVLDEQRRKRRGRGRRAPLEAGSGKTTKLRKVSAGELQFYRGGKGTLRPGPAYFTSGEWLAKMYGPVQRHRLYLRNPKFVTDAEWGGFDSISLRLDPSPAHRLRAKGYDSAVWIKETAQGPLYNVYALSGTDAIKKPKTQPRKRRSAATKIKWGTPFSKKGGGYTYQFGSLPGAMDLFNLDRAMDGVQSRWRRHHKQYDVGVYRLRVSAPGRLGKPNYASTLGIGPLKEMRKLAQKYIDEGGGPIEWTRENAEKWDRISDSWGR